MSDITICHNPTYGTPRNTLEMICNSGTESVVILYSGTPPSRDELVRLTANMDILARALLRRNIEPYEELGLVDDKFADNQLTDFTLQHPILINRPIVATPLGTKLCRLSEIVLDVLPESQKGTFTKEDGEETVNEADKRLK